MATPFPFEDLPDLVKDRVLECLDGKTLGVMRRVSKASHTLASRNYLIQRMQVQIKGVTDILDLSNSSRSSKTRPLWTNFKIDPNISMTSRDEETRELIPTLLHSHFGPTIREFESNMRITYEELEKLLSLQHLQVLRSWRYIDMTTINNNGVGPSLLENLRELVIQACPVMGRVLARAPNLQRLTLVTNHWEGYYSSSTQFYSAITAELLSYLTNRFYSKKSSSRNTSRSLTINFSKPPLFTTCQLVSICALCHPVKVVKLQNIPASSLPNADDQLEPKVLESLNCISLIHVGINSDNDKVFPSEFCGATNNPNPTNKTAISFTLDVRDGTKLDEIQLPSQSLTHIQFKIDTHSWSLHHYHENELEHALGQMFDQPRPQLVGLEIVRLVLDLNELVDAALDWSLFPNLTTLSMKRFGNDPVHFEALCEKLSKLERLTLSHVRDEHFLGQMEGQGVSPILKLTQLRNLTISQSHITQRSLEVLSFMNLDALIIEDSNCCARHVMTLAWMDKLLVVGGPLVNWISRLELPKPVDIVDECTTITILKERCKFLHTLKFSQPGPSKYADEIHESSSLICRLVREAGPDIW